MKIDIRILLWALALVITGCTTAHVDWNARVGTYTFDQAVNELGPPDKQTQLTDGRTVADWITRYPGGPSVSVGTGFSAYPGGVTYVQTYPPNYYEDVLRLTFNTNHVLENWKKR
jgi:hypothetical protein